MLCYAWRSTNAFQLGLLGDRSKEKAEPVDFVEQARLTKEQFGGWQVSYSYDARGPRWRLDDRDSSRGDR